MTDKGQPKIWKGPSGPIPTRAELGLDDGAPAPGLSTGLLSSILNATGDGLLVIDLAGKILAWNDMYGKFTSLPQGEIIAPVVGQEPADTATFHNSFQEPERFLRAGGQRGRQLRALGIEASRERVVLHLRDDSPLDAAKVMELCSGRKSPYKLTPDMRLTRRFEGADPAATGIARAETLLSELARCTKV